MIDLVNVVRFSLLIWSSVVFVVKWLLMCCSIHMPLSFYAYIHRVSKKNEPTLCRVRAVKFENKDTRKFAEYMRTKFCRFYSPKIIERVGATRSCCAL